jgi:uncharacterized coiled-coil DUF342 family protein
MRSVIGLLLAFPAAVCLAQTPDSNQRFLEELNGIRSALDRLAQAINSIGKQQDETLTLLRLMAYESQLRDLQSEQRDLAAQERECSGRVAALEATAHSQEGGASSGGVRLPATPPDSPQSSEIVEKLASARRTRDEIRARLESGRLSIIEIRGRVERARKALDQTGR